MVKRLNKAEAEKSHIRVLMINPPRYQGLPVIREERCEIIEGSSILEPYSLLQAAALIEDKVDSIRLVDANALDLSFGQLEQLMKDTDFNVLIFKFTPTSFFEDIKVAKLSKRIRPNAKTVGLCYSLAHIAAEVMKEVPELDIYIRQEYEVATPDLIKNLGHPEKVNGIAYRQGNRILATKPAEPIANYDSLPIAAFHLLPSLDPYYISVKHGQPFTIIYTSKGCPYTCMFCNVSQSKPKLKSVDRIMEEIDYLKKTYNIRTLSFFDETFTLDENRVREFCRRIKGYNIKWYCNTRVNLVNPPLLKLMRQAGCRSISFGIESGSQKILDSVNKRTTVQQCENAIKWCYEAGIKMHCSFVFGLPGETKGTIDETLKFLKRNLPMSVEFNIATPYPGTRLLQYYIENGNIPADLPWYDLYQDKANFLNRELSNEYIEKIRTKAYLVVYTNPRWFFRNFIYTLRNPDDLKLAVRYVQKTIKDIFTNFTIVRHDK